MMAAYGVTVRTESDKVYQQVFIECLLCAKRLLSTDTSAQHNKSIGRLNTIIPKPEDPKVRDVCL